MPTSNPVPSNDPSDLLHNAGLLDRAMNAPGLTFTDRLGNVRKTYSGFENEMEDHVDDVDASRVTAQASMSSDVSAVNTSRVNSQAAMTADVNSVAASRVTALTSIAGDVDAVEAAASDTIANEIPAAVASVVADMNAQFADTESTLNVYLAQALAAGEVGSSGFNYRGAWATATVYAIGDVVDKDGVNYLTLAAHTSSTFATDLAATKWRFFFLSKAILPEAFGAVGYDTRAAAEAGTDSTTALKAALTQWYARGGTLFLSRWYRCTEALLLANSNTLTTIGTQPPLRITGVGGHATGRGEKANYGAGIVWTAETGAGVAKIDTRGSGVLVLDNCTLASSTGSGNVKPFVHTTFTVIKTGSGFALDGAVYGATAAEDGFILGGQTDHEVDLTFDRRSSDCGFQGYGTDITGVHCNGIRRLAVGQRFANAVRITKNVMWTTCGNNSATGAAIEFDGAPIAPFSPATCPYIHGNLIELTHYKYGIHLKNTAQADLSGNDGYDAGAGTLAMVYVDTATCENIRIRPSLAPSGGRPYVLPDPTTSTTTVISVLGSEAGQYDRVNSLKAGINGFPNVFGATLFNGDSIISCPILQPKTGSPSLPDGTILFFGKRATDATTNPGATFFSINYGGGIAVSGNNAGNIANGLAQGASWWGNGCSWGFNGLTGTNMGQNSGTGASIYTAQNFSFVWKDHTGAIVGRIGNHGGGGQATLQLGTTFDVGLYRHSSTVLRSPTKLTADSGIGVGNSASATALGTLSKKMEVFDASGTSLGFVPIYTSIT